MKRKAYGEQYYGDETPGPDREERRQEMVLAIMRERRKNTPDLINKWVIAVMDRGIIT